MNSGNYRPIIDRFDQISVMVIGDIMLDQFIMGIVTRISPEAPVPLVNVTDEFFTLGGAANAVRNIRALGGRVVISGVIGNDLNGLKVIELLKTDDIDTQGVIICDDRSTTVKSRVITGDHHILRYDKEERGPISAHNSKEILKYVEENITTIDLLLISDYDKGVITRPVFKDLIDIAQGNEVPVLVYPKIKNSIKYMGVTLVITTIENASQLTGIAQINETSVRNMGQWLLTHLGCENILITRGNDGMSLFHHSGEYTPISPISMDLYTPLGVMDTIASITALSMSSCESNIIDAIQIANIGCYLMGKKQGNLQVSRSELINQLDLIGV